MNILIAGGGIVGRTITKALAKEHNVIVIERARPTSTISLYYRRVVK